MRKKTSLLEDRLFQMLIAAVTETLAKLANLKTAGFYQEAREEIDQDLEELLGLKADLVRRLSDAHIIEMLTVNDVIDVGRLHYVAELFREDGEILRIQGQTVEGQASQIRALNLFLEAAFAAGDRIPEIHERIESLFVKFAVSLSEDILFSLSITSRNAANMPKRNPPSTGCWLSPTKILTSNSRRKNSIAVCWRNRTRN